MVRATPLPRVIVVGGGVMGLATADVLARRGAQVTVLERFAVAHERGSSHGLSRAIRHEYGAQAIYTEMVQRSFPLWHALERDTGRRLYVETGVLTLGQEDDGHTLPGYDTMRAAGLPVERWSAAECARRFPQFVTDGYPAITFNPLGGFMRASACLEALAQRLRRYGGELREGAAVRKLMPQREGARVWLDNGDTLAADRVVITVGPWIQDLLPDLHLPVRATHQQVHYLGGLPAERFSAGHFPVFLAEMEYYGFPLDGPGWLKVASHIFGPTQDTSVPQVVDPAETERVRAWVRRVIPEAAEAPLVASDTCMYDLVADEDFLLDRHPATEHVIIGSGFSGHGFKFAPLIGELLAALVLDEQPVVPLDRFQLARVLGTVG